MYDPTEPLNLDCESRDLLLEVIESGDSPASVVTYACGVLAAREHRLAGRIADALAAERDLDRLYRRIPESLRW